MKLFLQKNAKFLSAGGSAPRPSKQPPIANQFFEQLKQGHYFFVISANI